MPTNAELLIAASGPPEATVVGGGESVTVTLERLGTLRDAFQGQLSLAPGTTYEVRRGFDNEVVTTFTTGGGPDEAPPAAPPLDDVFLGRADLTYNSSCGDERVQVELDIAALPSEIATIALSMPTRNGQLDEIFFPDELELLGGPSGEYCTIPVSLSGGSETCVELRGRDQAGNVGPPSTICTTVRDCAPVGGRVDLRDCELAGGCSAGGTDSSGVTFLLAVLAIAIARRPRSRQRRPLR